MNSFPLAAPDTARRFEREYLLARIDRDLFWLGKLMIRKLRDDWTSTRGGRNAWREFHDRFLSYGGSPIPLVRKAISDRGVL